MSDQFFTSSRGIAHNHQVKTLLKTNKIRLLSFLVHDISASAISVGWGYKPTADKARAFSKSKGIPYWALEEGFISWLNHPSQAKAHERLSYIIDKQGMYYDASKPSGLDACLVSAAGYSQARSERLLQQLIKLKISKYNQPRTECPSWLMQLKADKKPIILLVDQTLNDASIEYSGGGEGSFKNMLSWAFSELLRNASAQAVIKVHPDVILGRKQGYLYRLLSDAVPTSLSSRIHLLSQDVSPGDLLAMCHGVATVSSQLGFEALWQHKPVTCFAWPFYAGRGLTQDLAAQKLPYARPASSLLPLIHAALIQYPTYMHPDTQQPCEVEDIIDFLQAHFMARALCCEKLLVHDVSLWKRSFIPEFISGSAAKLSYTSGAVGRGLLDGGSGQHLLWGMKSPELAQKNTAWRMEDGFIRSVGLGADLRRPTSLIVDDLGIYYNGQQASRLEVLLNNCTLNDYESQRAQALLGAIQKNAITKYNVESIRGGNLARIQESARGRDIILVTGQFQQDLSMQYGALDIKTNMALLKKVSQQFPGAFIVYKEHPDVYSGVRPGKLEAAAVLQFANEYVTDINITKLFSISDRVCTICSLSGFEALLRGIKVNTYGLPFYAGWGLTEDHHHISRRKRTLNLLELVYVSLVLYPRYVNWQTRVLTTPESVIQQLSLEGKRAVALKSTWLSRQNRKVRYLLQSLFNGFWKKG